MDLKKRQAAIKTFKDPNGPDGRPRPMVLLISLKAGGVGLNLTNANHAFMVSASSPFTFRGKVGIQWSGISQMDCWWNAAVENQGSLCSVLHLLALTHDYPSYRPTAPSYARTDCLRQTFHCEILHTLLTRIPFLTCSFSR